MRKLAIVAAAVLSLAGLGLVTPSSAAASVPSVIVPAGPGCHFGVSANSAGVRSYKLAIKENPCGYTVRSVIHCYNQAMGFPGWHAGNKVYKIPRPGHPYYTRATCGLGVTLHLIQYGLQWTTTGKAPWQWAALGPNPRNNHPGAPQGKCSPHATGKPGSETFRLFIHRNRCNLDIQAAALCWFVGDSHNWRVGILGNPYFVMCGPNVLIEPAGYEWKKTSSQCYCHFTSIWPKPPANLK